MVARIVSAFGLFAIAMLLVGTPAAPARATALFPLCFDATCYRTNAQIETFMQSTASAYPQIASLTKTP